MNIVIIPEHSSFGQIDRVRQNAVGRTKIVTAAVYEAALYAWKNKLDGKTIAACSFSQNHFGVAILEADCGVYTVYAKCGAASLANLDVAKYCAHALKQATDLEYAVSTVVIAGVPLSEGAVVGAIHSAFGGKCAIVPASERDDVPDFDKIVLLDTLPFSLIVESGGTKTLAIKQTDCLPAKKTLELTQENSGKNLSFTLFEQFAFEDAAKIASFECLGTEAVMQGEKLRLALSFDEKYNLSAVVQNAVGTTYKLKAQ